MSAQIYVVSLPRSKERRRHIARQLESCGATWEWVDGVDARQTGVAALMGPEYVTPEFMESASAAPTPARGALRAGTVGCALGHKMAYERLLASMAPWALVLEDDVDLPSDLQDLAEQVGAQTAAGGAEVALLNFHCPGGLTLRESGSTGVVGARALAGPAELEHLSSGAAYVITREAARRLAGAAFPLRAFSDEWGWFVSAGLLERVRIVHPMPVRQNPTFRTTIDYYPAGSLHWWLREVVSLSKLDHLPGMRALVQRKRLRDMERWGATGRVTVTSCRADDRFDVLCPTPRGNLHDCVALSRLEGRPPGDAGIA
jgi:glycosyl transferase, family 25